MIYFLKRICGLQTPFLFVCDSSFSSSPIEAFQNPSQIETALTLVSVHWFRQQSRLNPLRYRRFLTLVEIGIAFPFRSHLKHLCRSCGRELDFFIAFVMLCVDSLSSSSLTFVYLLTFVCVFPQNSNLLNIIGTKICLVVIDSSLNNNPMTRVLIIIVDYVASELSRCKRLNILFLSLNNEFLL